MLIFAGVFLTDSERADLIQKIETPKNDVTIRPSKLYADVLDIHVVCEHLLLGKCLDTNFLGVIISWTDDKYGHIGHVKDIETGSLEFTLLRMALNIVDSELGESTHFIDIQTRRFDRGMVDGCLFQKIMAVHLNDQARDNRDIRDHMYCDGAPVEVYAFWKSVLDDFREQSEKIHGADRE